MQPVYSATRVQGNDWLVNFSILKPRSTVRTPSSALHEDVDVLSEIRYSLLFRGNGFNSLCLAFIKHLNYVLGSVLYNG